MTGDGDEGGCGRSQGLGDATVADPKSDSEAIRSLRAELDEVIRDNLERRQAIRALDREVVQLRAMLAEAERQMGNIRQTFIYRIGEIIVSTRSWKGIRQLPRRLLALRRAYREKRGLVGAAGATRVSLAERLRHADEAIRILEAQGIDASVRYVHSLPTRDAGDKARAFLELAHAVYRTDPARAASLAAEAGGAGHNDPRLRSLILSLFDHGEVDAPALILSTVTEALCATPVDRARRETILAQERQLASPLSFPIRAPRSDGQIRVAVVASRSQPHHIDAQAFRAETVVGAVQAGGLEAWLITPPGYQYPSAGDGQPTHRILGSLQLVRMPPVNVAPGVFDRYIPIAGAFLKSEFERLRITHVYALGEPTWAAAACWAAMESGAAFTLDIGEIASFGSHIDHQWSNTQRFRTGMALLSEMARVADRVIVRSSAIAAAYRQLDIPGKLEVVPDSIPPEWTRVSDAELAEFRSILGLADQKVIGVMEPLDMDKGLFDLIDALPSIREDQPDTVVVLAGAGHGSEAVRQRAAIRGVGDAVIVCSEVQRRKISELVSLFTVSVFPSRREWLPGLSAPFELQAALALGSPIVAAHSPWSLEWIEDGVTGLVFEPGNIDDLVKSIKRLMGDPSEAARLAAAGGRVLGERASRSQVQSAIMAQLQSSGS